jgi:hypothetical protein
MSRAENTSVYPPHFLCLPYLYVTIICPRAACSYTPMLDASAFSEMPTPIYQTSLCHVPADSNTATAARTSDSKATVKWLEYKLSCGRQLYRISPGLLGILTETCLFFLSRGYWRDNALVTMSGTKKRSLSYHPSTIQQAVRLSVKQWTWHISTSVLPREHNYKILIEQKRLVQITLVLQFFRQVLHKNCAVLGHDTASCGKSLPTFRDNLFISWLNRAK